MSSNSAAGTLNTKILFTHKKPEKSLSLHWEVWNQAMSNDKLSHESPKHILVSVTALWGTFLIAEYSWAEWAEFWWKAHDAHSSCLKVGVAIYRNVGTTQTSEWLRGLLMGWQQWFYHPEKCYTVLQQRIIALSVTVILPAQGMVLSVRCMLWFSQIVTFLDELSRRTTWQWRSAE